MSIPLSRPDLDVAIATLDLDVSFAFYRDLMGFEPISPRSTGPRGAVARLKIGAHSLKLDEFAVSPEFCPGGTDQANGIRLMAFILADLDAVLERFDRAGHAYRRLKVPDRAPFEIAFASDADGNALELVGLRQPVGEAFKTRLQIGLTVPDLSASRKFYGDVLGLEEEPEMKLPPSMGVVGDTRFGFVFGRTTVKFWSHGGALPVRTGAPERWTGIRSIRAWVEDVDATCETLRGRGVPVAVEPTDSDDQARVMCVSDPDGNWIEFASPLGAR